MFSKKRLAALASLWLLTISGWSFANEAASRKAEIFENYFTQVNFKVEDCSQTSLDVMKICPGLSETETTAALGAPESCLDDEVEGLYRICRYSVAPGVGVGFTMAYFLLDRLFKAEMFVASTASNVQMGETYESLIPPQSLVEKKLGTILWREKANYLHFNPMSFSEDGEKRVAITMGNVDLTKAMGIPAI